jgi:hypothetical protein
MGTVCAAARSSEVLPQRTRQLLQQLFPSAYAITATVPSADGLGMSVVTLMQPAPLSSPRGAAAQPQLHPAAAQQVAQPLAAGGVLSFGLTAQPPAAEQRLMAAFAAELSSRLGGGPCMVRAQAWGCDRALMRQPLAQRQSHHASALDGCMLAITGDFGFDSLPASCP